MSQSHQDSTPSSPFWLECGCFALFIIGMLVTCSAASSILWSVAVPYHGNWTAFHIISLILILLHGSISGMIILILPIRNWQSEDISKLYYELILAVGNKHEGETRHQTALRYITQSELGSGECASQAPSDSCQPKERETVDPDSTNE